MTSREVLAIFRSLRRSPRFAVLAVATLGLGVGACATIFSVLHGVLLRPLPYPEPERLVTVWQLAEDGGRSNLSLPNYEDLRDANRSLESFARYGQTILSVAGGSAPARLGAAAVGPGFFETLGVSPRRGRLFQEEDQRPGAAATVVVGHGYWESHLGAEPDLDRHRLRLEGEVYQVIGVMPPGFEFPPGVELWLPADRQPGAQSRTAHNWRGLARLADDVPLAAARADLSAIARRLAEHWGDETWMRDAALVPLLEEQVGQTRTSLWILMGAVGFLLLVACANVTNLLLARLAVRQRELAVRRALGASRLRLTGELVIEILVVALLGAALGVVLAFAGVELLRALEPARVPRLQEIRVDTPVLAFAVAVATLSALGVGLTAAARATGGGLDELLRGTPRGASAGVPVRMRGALVIGQIAVTVLLLVGAGLLGRSLWLLLDVDPGFESADRLVVQLSYPSLDGDDDRRSLSVRQEELVGRLSALPGVERVGGIDLLPIASGGRNGAFVELRPGERVADFDQFAELAREPGRMGNAEFRVALPGWFDVVGIPLLRGRTFDSRDTRDGVHVAVVSESLAAGRWPGEDPLGKRIEFGNMDGILEPLTVVGVVGDIRHRGLHSPPRPTLYTNGMQRPSSSLAVVLKRGEGSPGGAEVGSLVPEVRRVVAELEPDLPPRFRTFDEVIAASVSDRQFQLVVLGVFAGAALLLAGVGIFGVTAFLVAERTREIGVRMALGARAADVSRLVLGQGAAWAAVGIAGGLLAALALGRVLRSLLFEIEPIDPVTWVVSSTVVAAFVLLACLTPARRASRIDPMVALREE